MSYLQSANLLTPIEAFERFLRLSVASGAARPRTLRSYREGLEIHLGWCKDTYRNPRSLTYDDFLEYRRWLIDKKLSRATIRLRLTAARVLYAALQRWGIRLDNPAAGVKAPKEKQTRADKIFQKALSPTEVRSLFLALPMSSAPQDVRDRAIITLLIFHGLREEELTELIVGALDLAALTWLIVPGKGDKTRTLVLTPEARKELLAWLDVAHASRDIGMPLFYRFDNAGRSKLSTRAIQRIVNKYLARAGLKRAGRSAHSLRHTYAVLAVMGGAEREAVGDSMGHAQLSTTDIYTRVVAKYQKNPGDAVSRALKAQEK